MKFPIYFSATFILLTGALNLKALGAGPVPTLGKPTFSGTGCNDNSTGVALAPDGSALTVIFDEYIVRAGNGVREESKTCSASIPLSIPAGYSLTVFKVDYRGFNSLPKQAKTEYRTQYEFQDSPSGRPDRIKKFQGPLFEDFLDTNVEHIQSKCGGNRILQINTVLTVRTNVQQEQAFSQIDSEDVSVPSRKKDRAIRYQIGLKQCRNHTGVNHD